MITNLLSVIEQQNKALKHILAGALSLPRFAEAEANAAIAAGKQALEQTQGEACGNCSGSGRMVRDPDIGTDQECFVCNGSGHYATHPQATEPAPSTAGEARACEVFSLGEWCLWPLDRYDEAKQRGWPVRKLVVEAAAILSAPALPETDPNAPWLTKAHMLCTDHGVPQGHIEWRLEVLRELLSTAMPVGELTDAAVKTWKERKGLLNSEPFRAFIGVEWEMQAEIDELRAILAAARTQPVREPLTEEQIAELHRDAYTTGKAFTMIEVYRYFARAIEAAHGIK